MPSTARSMLAARGGAGMGCETAMRTGSPEGSILRGESMIARLMRRAGGLVDDPSSGT